MTNEYLRPPDLRTHLEDPPSTSSRARSKSVTSSSSRTSFISSLASKFIEPYHHPTVRAELQKAGWSERNHKSKAERKAGGSSVHQSSNSEGRSASRNPDNQGLLPLPANLGIGAIFNLVDHQLPPTIHLIPPTAPASETSDRHMANNNHVQLSVWDAALILSSHGCRVRLPPLPANPNTPAGRPVSPNQRSRPGGPALQGQGRVDRSPDAALDLVRKNGGEVEFPPRSQEVRQMVGCDIIGCNETFSSDAEMQQHRQMHPFCLQCDGQYAERSHEEHLRRHPGFPH